MTIPKLRKPQAPPKGVVNPKAQSSVVPKPKKEFQIGEWDGDKSGFKSLIYARSGMGKTTLLSQLDPVFIGIDDGGRKLTNPLTGKKLRFVEGVKTFPDVRHVLQSTGLFENEKDVVLDTATALQPLAEIEICETIRHDGGGKVTSLEGYGYGKGYKHLYDTIYSILTDCDELIRRGINVHLICQLNACLRAHPGGDDYLEDGPNLYHGVKNSLRNAFCEWADNVFFIDYSQIESKNKKASSDNTRVIFIQPEIHFIAKSRTLDVPAVTFDSAEDVTLWRYLFPKRFPSE